MISSSKRSTTVPKVAVGAGMIAASTFVAPPAMSPEVSGIGDADRNDVAACVAKWQTYDEHVAADEQVGKLVVELPIIEDWSEQKHGREFRQLVVLKAKSRGRLSKTDEIRLSNLQRMRRASLPLSMSYEEFIKERDRKVELQQLLDLLADYKLKYNSTVNG